MFNNPTKLLSSSAQDLHQAMKMLGLNPSEQEVVDIPNIIARYTYELGLSYKFGLAVTNYVLIMPFEICML